MFFFKPNSLLLPNQMVNYLSKKITCSLCVLLEPPTLPDFEEKQTLSSSGEMAPINSREIFATVYTDSETTQQFTPTFRKRRGAILHSFLNIATFAHSIYAAHNCKAEQKKYCTHIFASITENVNKDLSTFRKNNFGKNVTKICQHYRRKRWFPPYSCGKRPNRKKVIDVCCIYVATNKKQET